MCFVRGLVNELIRNRMEENGVDSQLKSLKEREIARVIDALKSYDLVAVKENARRAAEKKQG